MLVFSIVCFVITLVISMLAIIAGIAGGISILENKEESKYWPLAVAATVIGGMIFFNSVVFLMTTVGVLTGGA